MEKEFFSAQYNVEKPLSFSVLTDLHYFSKRNGIEGEAFLKKQKNSQKVLLESEEVIKEAFDRLKEEDSDFILIHGDLTNNGEIFSHEEIYELLKDLKNAGKRVFVTYSTHDYRREPEELTYKIGDKVIDVMHIDQIRHRYDEFGYEDAVATFDEAGSYAVIPAKGYRLLCLNDDVGNAHAGFKDDHLEWIKEQVAEARKNNEFIFACEHHPVISPSPLYDIFGGKWDVIESSRERAAFYADLGIQLVFTGHTHIHDISYLVSQKGNLFYDISTSALPGYPPCYRKIVLDPDNEVCHVNTVVLDKSRYLPEIEDLPLFLKKNFLGMIEEVVTSGAAGDIPRFSALLYGMSVRDNDIKKIKPFVKPVCKWLSKLTIGKVGNWTRKETGLKKKDYADMKKELALPYMVDLAAGLYGGDPAYSPDTVKYKITMGLISIIDSLLVDTLKINLKAKLKYGTVSELIDPLVYNAGIPDYDTDIDLDNARAFEKLYKEGGYQPPFKSHKGPWIIATIALIAVLLLPIEIPVGIIVGLILLIKKAGKKKDK